MRLKHSALIAVAFAVAQTVAAQTGSLVGSVSKDSLGHAIGAAEIQFPELGRGAHSNYLGEFRVDGIVPGKHVVTIRSTGFALLVDSVNIVAGKMLERDFVLTPGTSGAGSSAVALEAVKTTAATTRFRSPMLNAVEERRLAHQGGQFMSDSVLRQHDNEKLVDVLNRVGGLITFQRGPGAFVASGRSVGDGGPALQRVGPAVATPCYVTLFVDGVKIFQGPVKAGNPAPDFSMYSVTNYAAVEYYAGGASLPAQFNATGSSCGTLLLWSREK